MESTSSDLECDAYLFFFNLCLANSDIAGMTEITTSTTISNDYFFVLLIEFISQFLFRSSEFYAECIR